MSKKVFIELSDAAYETMFTNEGWVVVDDIEQADLILFTGGADVNPSFYGMEEHNTTFTNSFQDRYCVDLFTKYVGVKPMAGICRGAQFLHVMADGELVQHCDNHAVMQGHKAKVHWLPNTTIHVSSTHHQMMYDDSVGEVLMSANNLSTYKETQDSGGVKQLNTGEDIEAMYYEDINAISFQPHPEFSVYDHSLKECKDAFFFIVNNYLKGI